MKRRFLIALTFAATPCIARDIQPARPFSEAFIVGRALIAQARDQAAAARRDRDERARAAYADAAKRSCANPGSLTQAELDRLPEPYDKDMLATMPAGLGPCETVVYLSLGRGADAEEIRLLSVPKVAIEVHPERRPEPVRGEATTTFMQMLPYVKDFAVASCKSPGEVPLLGDFKRPKASIIFIPQADEAAAQHLSSGLGLCELRLFRRLISVIRFGYPQNITDKWMRDVVLEYKR